MPKQRAVILVLKCVVLKVQEDYRRKDGHSCQHYRP